MRYLLKQVQKDGTLWVSPEAFEGDERHAHQNVAAGYISGEPRWAEELDGSFLFGMGAHGEPLYRAPNDKRDLRDLVCFASSFRLSGERGGVESPNITHATLDGKRTLCGRTGWETTEGWDESNGPCCLVCRKALERKG